MHWSQTSHAMNVSSWTNLMVVHTFCKNNKPSLKDNQCYHLCKGCTWIQKGVLSKSTTLWGAQDMKRKETTKHPPCSYDNWRSEKQLILDYTTPICPFQKIKQTRKINRTNKLCSYKLTFARKWDTFSLQDAPQILCRRRFFNSMWKIYML